MAICWNEGIGVGNAKIDNDHKYLISMINAIDGALNCEESVPVLLGHVSRLIDYTHKHFEREEAYQLEIDFPHREAHKEKHKELLRQINRIHENLKTQTELDVYQFTTPPLVDTLKDWLMHHISHEDMKMKPFFEAL